MARKPRDYAAEYRRRMERGEKLNAQIAAAARKAGRKPVTLTRSQLRGHPGKSQHTLTRTVKRVTASTAEKYRDTVKAVQKGKSLTAALKETGLSRSAFARLNEKSGDIAPAPPGSKRRFVVAASHQTPVQIIDKSGKVHDLVVVGRDRQKAFGYRTAVAQAIRTNSTKPLRPYKTARVRDINGRTYSLNTDLTTLKREFMSFEPQEVEDRDIYRVFDLAA